MKKKLQDKLCKIKRAVAPDSPEEDFCSEAINNSDFNFRQTDKVLGLRSCLSYLFATDYTDFQG